MSIPRQDAVRMLLSAGTAIALHLGVLLTVDFVLPGAAPPDRPVMTVRLETRIVPPAEPSVAEDMAPPDAPPLVSSPPASPPAEPDTAESDASEINTSQPEASESPASQPATSKPAAVKPRIIEAVEAESPPIESSPLEPSPTPTDVRRPELASFGTPPHERAPETFRDTAPTPPAIQPERYVEPRYPEAARRSAIEGAVVISLRIDRRGRVEDVQLSESSGFDLLDREALRAVRLWRFSREDAGRESVHRIVFRLD